MTAATGSKPVVLASTSITAKRIMDAIRAKNAAMVRLLLDHGADPDLKTNVGTPRTLGDKFASAEVRAVLAEHPAR